MVVDVVKADEIGCESSRLPMAPPSRLKQLTRYAGYSAEFLDRVEEPNGNIPHKQIEGRKGRKQSCHGEPHR